MVEFKVGDRVRSLVTEHEYTQGEIFEVSSVFRSFSSKYNSHTQVVTKRGASWGLWAQECELVTSEAISENKGVEKMEEIKVLDAKAVEEAKLEVEKEQLAKGKEEAKKLLLRKAELVTEIEKRKEEIATINERLGKKVYTKLKTKK